MNATSTSRRWLWVVPVLFLLLTQASRAVEFGFPLGESLVYKIYWGKLPVGEARVHTDWASLDERKLLHIRFRVVTGPMLSKIYPVNDIHECFIDPETFLPVRYIKKVNEGRYHADEVTDYDYAKGEAVMQRNGSKNRRIFKIGADARDVISFMYFSRSQDFAPGTSNRFQVISDEKMYDLEIQVLQKENVEILNDIKIRSIKMEPIAKFEGLFVRKGRMWMWISDDEGRLMTKMKAEIPVASVQLRLSEIRAQGENIRIRLPEKAGRAEKEKQDVTDDKQS